MKKGNVTSQMCQSTEQVIGLAGNFPSTQTF